MAAHAEWRDDVTALLATQLAVELAQASGHRLHVLHLTSGIEADWLEGITVLPSTADDQGAIITTETLPQHLTFDETDVEREGTRLKMNPHSVRKRPRYPLEATQEGHDSVHCH